MKPFFLFLFLTLHLSVFSQPVHELWYKAPVREWTEALPVGNGRIGAMIYGKYDQEHIQLNEESIWGGSQINNNNPRAKENLGVIQQSLFRGEYEKAWKMTDQFLLGTPPEIRSYQPLGDLKIDYAGKSKPDHYKRSLNLHNGVARTAYTIAGNNIVQELFVSAPQDVMVLRIQSDQPINTQLTLSRQRDTDHYRNKNGIAFFEGQVNDPDLPKKGPGGKHMRFAAAMKILSSDGQCSPVTTDSTVGYKVSGARQLTLVITGHTDYNINKLNYDRTIDPLLLCTNLLNQASAVSYEKLRAMHERDHRAMFDRVKFALGSETDGGMATDERLEKVKAGAFDPGLVALYYQYGRYLLMGSSRKPGRLPANLQGIWNKEYTAKWNSDFHTNINLQMNYWPAESGNLPETSEVLAGFMKKLMVPGAVTAREMYGAKGWTLHHLTDVYGRTGVADGAWGFSPMAGPWMTFPVFEHYKFTKDLNYLKNTAYPMTKGAVQFVLDFLIPSPEGFLVTNPSHSPENPFFIPGSSPKVKTYLSYGTTFDSHIINGLFDNFLQAANELNLDRDLVLKVKKLRKKLPPVKVAPNGTIQEWIHDYEEAEPGHRHISHLLGLYPLGLINPSDTTLFHAANRTIQRRLSYSTKYVGWSSAWMINFYARLLNGNQAGEQVQQLLRHSTLNSLLNTIPPFQIDGNFGGAAGIAEMLVQSQNKEIHLLPALPDAWQVGAITGIRARGGYEVDMSWAGGKLASLLLKADTPGKCKIRYQNRVKEVYLKKGSTRLSVNELFDK